MHVFQAFVEFFLVANKAIPILVLPKRSAGPTPGVISLRHDFLRVVQYLLDQDRIVGPDQGVPVVGHQNITAEQKPQPSRRIFQHVDDQCVFRFAESPEPRSKIDTEKEYTVGVAEATDIGHAGRLAPLPKVFKAQG